MNADIPHRRSTQHGVTNGMEQYVGIAVPLGTQMVWDLDTPDPQVSTLHKLMEIDAETYPV
jgi:hypothetical protein